MILDKYIVIEGKESRYGSLSLTARMVERVPKLKGNEVALRLAIDLPKALFTRPTLEARMTIPDEAVPTIEITPEVTDNISKIIRESTGLTMSVNVVPFEKPSEDYEEDDK
jgi:hypothetical protein